MAGDGEITADLLQRLRRHYLPPQPMPGGVFVTEVGGNGRWGDGRQCDAIYVGFTASSGRLMVGHEVKASRGDWLSELRKPDKADMWADQCHEWWLVTVPGVVRDGELPAGWGLMHPGRSRTRMEIVVPARRHEDRQPSWDAVRSLMARLDTLQRAERRAFDIERLPKLRAQVEKEWGNARELTRRLDGESESKASDILRELGELLGVRVSDGDWGNSVTPEEVKNLAALLRLHVSLREAQRRLVQGYDVASVTRLREKAQALVAELAAAEAAIEQLAARPPWEG